ncbi:MAG: hypothetical protein H7X80_05325 [bacterium]|nr:hypothetical protein [Candidatus Kapabacteria bacterium]
MKLRYAPLAIILALIVSISACKEDPVSGTNLDPTLTTTPCDSADSPTVGTNGFIMSGTGYQGTLVKFADFTRSVEFEFTPGGAAIFYSITDTLAVGSDATTQMKVDFHIPSVELKAYPFNNLVGDSATYIRVELIQDGIGKKIYKSQAGLGRITLDSVVGGARASGKFCGMLQDSTSRAQIALMSGHFSVAE